MTNEAKLRIFKARKISYWRQYRQGMLSWASVEILVRAVNTAADKDDLSVAVDSLTKYWTVGKLGLCFRRRLVLLFTRTKYQHIPTGRFRKKMYYIAVSPWFGYLIYGTLILNLIPIIWEIVQNPKYFTPVFNALKVLAVLFFLIYLVEFLIKVIAFTFCGYWKSHWNKFDFFILLWAGADVAIDWIFIFTHVADNSTVISLAVTARVFSILRLVRLLRLSHFLIPATLHWMDRALDMKLLKGYEIGRGFVTGEDDVIKVLHYLVENKQIYEETKCILESGRLVVIDQLGTLQNDLPWVAVTVKTKQALHKILNTMTNAVEEQKSEGKHHYDIQLMPTIAYINV
ncbi:hypothetical protein C0J52_06779 [Blattella germanica]|nr:hypothetical protein C0J52_06779 [Blattella germanica]